MAELSSPGPGVFLQLKTPSFHTQFWARRTKRGYPGAGSRARPSPTVGGVQAAERTVQPFGEA
eukprot:15439171-Alexandrium_andersonii.AAC.1